MREHVLNLRLYRTLIQLARVSARLSKNRKTHQELLAKREALVDKAAKCGLAIPAAQQEHLCARLVH